MVLSRLPALVLEDNKHKEEEGKRAGEKEMILNGKWEFESAVSTVSASTLQELISSFISLLYLISRAWNNFRFLSRPHLKEKKDKKFDKK